MASDWRFRILFTERALVEMPFGVCDGTKLGLSLGTSDGIADGTELAVSDGMSEEMKL